VARDREIEARGESVLVSFYFRNYFIWVVQPFWRLVLASGLPPNAVTGIAAGLGAASGVEQPRKIPAATRTRITRAATQMNAVLGRDRSGRAKYPVRKTSTELPQWGQVTASPATGRRQIGHSFTRAIISAHAVRRGRRWL